MARLGETAFTLAGGDLVEVDLTEAIADFTARQFALQASLQVAGNMLQLTLLDFI